MRYVCYPGTAVVTAEPTRLVTDVVWIPCAGRSTGIRSLLSVRLPPRNCRLQLLPIPEPLLNTQTDLNAMEAGGLAEQPALVTHLMDVLASVVEGPTAPATPDAAPCHSSDSPAGPRWVPMALSPMRFTFHCLGGARGSQACRRTLATRGRLAVTRTLIGLHGC